MTARRALAAVVLLSASASVSTASGAFGCNQVYDFEDPVDGGGETAPQGCVATGCPLSTLHCDTGTGRCEECLQDGDCAAPHRRCDTARHLCFECLELTDDCGAGRICVVESGRCVHTCPAGLPCAGNEHCDLVRGICVRCTTPADCASDPDRRVCDPDTGACVGCLSDKSCTMAPRLRCDLAEERCVECVRAADCPPTLPICDPSQHRCVAG